jgi:predicted Ser/Thr protein kinase
VTDERAARRPRNEEVLMPPPDSSLSALAPQDRDLLASWLADFDGHWRPGALEERVRRLPPPPSPLRLPALGGMVKIDLARRWQSGERAYLEEYLRRYPELGTAATVSPDLLQAEVRARQQHGAAAPPAEAGRFAGGTAARDDTRTADAPTPGRTTPRLSAGADVPGQVGRYRILKKLGQGGMGAVYLAHDTELDRPVALKVPQFGPEDGPQVLERFRREARAAATLHHPNLCPVYDVGEVGGVHFLTMAFIEGKPLSDFVRGGKAQPPRQAAALVRSLARGLQEAHARGIIHRDLKPSNVMINQRKEPVVMDFGLARRSGSGDVRLTQTGAVMGTPAYMAPEQVRGDVQAMGPACDIYSLGVILYELLTGRLPFQGPVTAVLAQILVDEPEPPSKHRPGLDPALEAICLKALAKEPGRRHASMADLAADLTRYLRAADASSAAATAPLPPAAAGPSVRPAAAGKATARATVPVPAARKERVRPRARAAASPARRSRWPWLVLGAAGVLALAALLLAQVVLRVRTRTGEIVVAVNEPGAQVYVDDELKVTITSPSDREPVRIEVPEGKHVLKVVKGGFTTETKEFTLQAGTPHEIRVTLRQVRPITPQGSDPPAAGGRKGKQGWVPLFNGKDLTGWKTHPEAPGDWRVENGILVGRGPQKSLLYTERGDYQDFHLRVEARINDGGNSGLYFRNAFTPGWTHGYQAQIDSSRHKAKTGSLYVGKGTPEVTISEVLVPADTWFTQEVICRGNRIIIKVNGRTTVDYVDRANTFTRGHLALEVFDPPTVVQFRRIEVKEQKPVATPPAGWQPLFNGKDLIGWKTHPAQPFGWSVEDGLLTGRAERGNTHLFSDLGDFANFHLRAEVQVNADGNSGIFFRSPFGLTRLGNRFPAGYEAQILHRYGRPTYLTGSLQNLVKAPPLPLGPGEWFLMEIIAVDNDLTVKVNGQVTAHYVDEARTAMRGHFALQAMDPKTTVVRFRKIEVKELPGGTAPGWQPLFNGTDLTGWVRRDGSPATWPVRDGYLEVGPGDILTRQQFGPDFRLHAEFWLPLMPGRKGQGRANSGIFLQGRYEIQVLDSYKNDTYPSGSVGALYGLLAPDRVAQRKARRPPEQWQTFDITFHAPRVDDRGKVIVGGRLTVVHNGIPVIEDAVFTGPTGGALDNRIGTPGPILLQSHGAPVRFRNLRIKEVPPAEGG